MTRLEALGGLRIASLAALAFVGCGAYGGAGAAPTTPLPADSATTGATTGPHARADASSTPMLKLRRQAFVDAQGLGGEAFSVLMPVDWVSEGGVGWRLDNPTFAAYGAVRIRNPQGSEEFEIFPNLPFFWTNHPIMRSTNPPGSKYFGNVVRQPPASAVQALTEVFVPIFRGGAVGLRLVEAQPAPELAGAVRQLLGQEQGGALQVDAAKVRIEYDSPAGRMEEEIYGVVQAFAIPVGTYQGTATNVTWWIDYLFSFKARQGTLAQSARILQTIAFSFRLDPRWFDRYSRFVETLMRNQVQHIRSIGEIGRMAARVGEEIREDNLRRWERDQAVRDRLNENFSQHIRGVEAYYNPYDDKVVELPAGYTSVWVNRLGEYVLSESLDYNPNVGSNLEWQRIEHRR